MRPICSAAVGRAGTTITTGLFDMFFSAERSLKTTATTWFPCDPAQYEFRNRTIFENNRKYAKVMQICNVLCVLAQHYLRERSLGTTVFSHIFTLYFYVFLYNIDSPSGFWELQPYRTTMFPIVSMCSCSALFLRTVFGKYNDITIFFEPPWYFLYVKRSPGCCTEWFLATTLHTNWFPRTKILLGAF